MVRGCEMLDKRSLAEPSLAADKSDPTLAGAQVTRALFQAFER
jgi:hypothetical protein